MELFKNSDIDWTYWCLDGYKCADQAEESYGLLTHDFKSTRNPKMAQQLKDVARPKPRLKKGGIKI